MTPFWACGFLSNTWNPQVPIEAFKKLLTASILQTASAQQNHLAKQKAFTQGGPWLMVPKAPPAPAHPCPHQITEDPGTQGSPLFFLPPPPCWGPRDMPQRPCGPSVPLPAPLPPRPTYLALFSSLSVGLSGSLPSS